MSLRKIENVNIKYMPIKSFSVEETSATASNSSWTVARVKLTMGNQYPKYCSKSPTKLDDYLKECYLKVSISIDELYCVISLYLFHFLSISQHNYMYIKPNVSCLDNTPSKCHDSNGLRLLWRGFEKVTHKKIKDACLNSEIRRINTRNFTFPSSFSFSQRPCKGQTGNKR